MGELFDEVLGWSDPVGFLAVDNVREVETQLRSVQFFEGGARPALTGLARHDAESAISKSEAAIRNTYKLPMRIRAFLGLFVVMFGLAALYLVIGWIVAGVLFLIFAPDRSPLFREASR